MSNNLSKTQIDKLGDRLRRGDISERDLRLLDEYRRSFSEAYEFVVRAIRDELRLKPTGRPAKSTTAIIEKLLRETIRLTQIQDIAGCRLIVEGIAEQESVASLLAGLFQKAVLVDRRSEPSHGYRAVHLIVNHHGRLVEIQVRTSLQHLWAELSEKVADLIDPSIKYGTDIKGWGKLLMTASETVANEEELELGIAQAEARGDKSVTLGTANKEVISIEEWRARQLVLKQRVLELFGSSILRVAQRTL